MTPDDALTHLRMSISILETKFLSRHLDSNSLSPLSEHDALEIDAFVVLAHAAFEDFFESVSIWVLDQSIEAWKNGKHLRSIATIFLHLGKKKLPKEKDTDPSSRYFDRVREELEVIKGDFSYELREKNHGIAEKYLRKIFYPLAIDITSDQKLLGSLDAFVKQRGAAAHKTTQGVTRTVSPGDTRIRVMDCLVLAEDIRSKAVEVVSFFIRHVPVPKHGCRKMSKYRLALKGSWGSPARVPGKGTV